MGRHEFPFQNHVCSTASEVRDTKRKPAPLLTKATSGPQVLKKL